MKYGFRTYLKSHQTPRIQENNVTFLWKGKVPPVLVGDLTGWEQDETVCMEKCEPGIWSYQKTFEQDAYIEYSYQVGEESLLDPFNPRKISNGVGGQNNYFAMPGYSASTLSKKKREVPHGTVAAFPVPTEYYLPGKHRTVRLYSPPIDMPVPLVVVWDGQDYFHRVHLNYFIDNLIFEGRIRPIALALVDNAGEELRSVEYTCNDATLAFLRYQVLPLAKMELNLVNVEAHPGAFGVLGASMGGLMALYTGLRMPEVFGNVLSQSGAFTLGEFDMIVYELIRLQELLPIKIWLDVGLYDLSGLLETNRRMRDLLNMRGYSFFFNEYHAGHNYPAWRDDLWRGFEALFGK